MRLAAGMAEAIARAYPLLLLSHLLLQLLMMTLFLMCVRLAGVSLVDGSSLDSVQKSEGSGFTFQFSVRRLLSWTTALGVLLATLRCISKDFWFFPSADGPMQILILIVINFPITLVCLWAGLGTRRPVVRYTALVLLVAAGVLATMLIIRVDSFAPAALWCALPALWMLGSTWLIRFAGYRVVWRRRWSVGTTSGSCHRKELRSAKK